MILGQASQNLPKTLLIELQAFNALVQIRKKDVIKREVKMTLDNF